MDKPGGQYAKRNKTDRRTIATWYHLFVESKIVKVLEAESRRVVARDCEGRKWGPDGQKVQFQ